MAGKEVRVKQLLTLKIEDKSKECRQLREAVKAKDKYSLEPPEETQPYQYLDSSLLRLTSHF